jgi:hypothetical protein
MYPQQIGELANQRVAELRKTAAGRRTAAVARSPRASIKNRAGWVLIHLGLRLALQPAEP